MRNIFKRGTSFFLGLSVAKRVVIVVLLVVAGWFLLTRMSGVNKAKPQYQTATAETGDIIATLSGSGSVTSGTQVSVSSPTDGVITEVYVKNGDEVAAGEQLFAVKSTATPQEKASAYASYLSAQNSLNAAQAKLNGLQATLFKANQDFVTGKGTADPDTDDPVYIEQRATWLQAEADFKNQSGVIAQTQAAYNAASLSYQQTQDATVTAPSAGTVANLSATPGTVVSASGNNDSSGSNANNASSNSSPVLLLGNFSDLTVTVQVSEVDVTKIRSGQKATVTIDALPDKTFVGTVSSIDTVGTASSGVVTFNAYVQLASPPATIQPGMTAAVIIQTDRRDSVLKIPSAAVQNTGGEETVRVMKNGKVTSVPVTTGLSSDSETEITSGLSEGDTVITSINLPTNGTTSQQTASPFGGQGGFGGGAVRIRTGGGGGGGRNR